ncbi:hypothetical protein JCM10908_005730 [Rhodotorula pacifica]|uniref:uncharacterized protein n=1 Tax=Rhodotorula pacifica TaxID=1495444 RepID=UPI00316B49C0
MKRKAADAVDLTADSGEEASSSATHSKRSTSSTSGPISTSKPKKQKKKQEAPARKNLDRAFEHAQSGFLAPRSILFGGKGTGKEHGGRLQPEPPSDSDDDADAPKKPKPQHETPNQTLNFVASRPEDPAELLDRLQYGEPSLLLLERGQGGLEDGTQPSETVGIDMIIGPDPDKHVTTALFAAPKVQTPWLPTRFTTMHLSKQRVKDEAEADHESLSDGDVDESKPKKKKKEKKPQKVRPWTKKPLLIVQDEDVNPDDSKIKTLVHRPRALDQQHHFGASFSLITRQSPDERFHLRIAIGRPEATPDAWNSVEHAIWVKDLPKFAQPVLSVDANPTHTIFSSSLLSFLRSESLDLTRTDDKDSKPRADALASLEQNLRLSDFSSSEDFRLVISHAGLHKGEDEVATAGGLTSLAEAVASLSPSCGGAGEWQVEYITPQVGFLSRKFLERLHAAAQGITPLEYIEGETDRAIAAKAAFAAAHRNANSEKVKVLYPTEDTVKACKEKAGRYLVRWEGEGSLDELKKGDLRRTVLRQLELKSGRLNGSALMLILHRPPPPAEQNNHAVYEVEPFEAFLYNGSHLPSPDSWGKYNRSGETGEPTCEFARTDLGVLYRCATAKTAKKLEKYVSDLVPYERSSGLDEFADDDEPALTVERKEKKPVGRPKGSNNGDGVAAAASGQGKSAPKR